MRCLSFSLQAASVSSWQGSWLLQETVRRKLSFLWPRLRSPRASLLPHSVHQKQVTKLDPYSTAGPRSSTFWGKKCQRFCGHILKAGLRLARVSGARTVCTNHAWNIQPIMVESLYTWGHAAFLTPSPVLAHGGLIKHFFNYYCFIDEDIYFQGFLWQISLSKCGSQDVIQSYYTNPLSLHHAICQMEWLISIWNTHLAVDIANRTTLWNIACHLVVTQKIFVEQTNLWQYMKATGPKKSVHIYLQVNGNLRNAGHNACLFCKFLFCHFHWKHTMFKVRSYILQIQKTWSSCVLKSR